MSYQHAEFFFMTKAIFIFIVALYLVLPLTLAVGEITLNWQLALCLPIILLLGVPHGAIDYVLYLKEKRPSKKSFILYYVSVVGLNGLLWIYQPLLAYIIFLLLSAYHFGQSQFSHLLENSGWLNKILYAAWGLAIISALMFFNLDEIHAIISQFPDFHALSPLHNGAFLKIGMLSFTVLALLVLTYLTYNKILSKESLLMEVLVFFMILLSLYLLPLIIGFTTYFIILHSIKVLKEEYTFLHLNKQVKSIKDFVNMIAPFSILSILGLLILFALIYIGVLKFSYGYMFLIMISSITTPHAFVMNHFYSAISVLKLNKQLSKTA